MWHAAHRVVLLGLACTFSAAPALACNLQKVTAHGLSQVPIEGSLIKGFGTVRHPLLGYIALHGGQDYVGRDPSVRAVANGIVSFSGTRPGYGLMVVIRHGQNVETVYAHLARSDVRPGACVTAGNEIGLEGETGIVTRPHLHFEIRRDGKPVDPAGFF